MKNEEYKLTFSRAVNVFFLSLLGSISANISSSNSFGAFDFVFLLLGVNKVSGSKVKSSENRSFSTFNFFVFEGNISPESLVTSLGGPNKSSVSSEIHQLSSVTTSFIDTIASSSLQ